MPTPVSADPVRTPVTLAGTSDRSTPDVMEPTRPGVVAVRTAHHDGAMTADHPADRPADPAASGLTAPGSLAVDVPGGRLHAAVWGPPAAPDVPTVLLLHGITGSYMAWNGFVGALPDVRLIVPDLRGRGASAAMAGPYGMARHADDMAALLDAAGVGQAVVVGHSMGAFVALVMARRHPERVSRLVLIDGGFPLPVPEGVPVEALLQAVIGPAIDRLKMTFPSREAYRDFWRAHPALAGGWSRVVEAYVDYDLVGEPPALRSRVNAEAVNGDGADSLTGADLPDAVMHRTRPGVLLAAEFGMLGAPPPLYPQELIDTWLASSEGLTARRIAGVNHYTILFDPRAIEEIAAEIRAAVSA